MFRVRVPALALPPFVIALVLIASDAVRAADPDAAADAVGLRLPSNLKVPEKLRPMLEDVLRRSPTFRQQMRTLRSARHVRMTIGYGNLSIWHVLRAESRVSRYEAGAVMVDTRLYTAHDAIEVIAHEVEHVCEQIEGLDVRALARRRQNGVSDTGGHFETRRAVDTGRQVAREALAVKAGAQAASF